MSSFFEDIPQEILPKTFTDAFRVVEELGLAYIWIDALCIIQKEEDNRDWLHESGRMRSIYGGGYVNIAASSATTVHEGLFSKLKHFNGGFTERVTARVTTSTYCMVKDFRSRDPYKEAVLETPLAKRGWALQEKLLSPRTISWGERGIVWECRTGTKSEFLPNGFSNRLLTKPQLVCPEDQSFDWTEIILQYSMMNLTLASDKLPALSGIARRQYEVTGDDYLAGMWRRDLAYQLAWSKFHPRVERPAWRAPTWSWVSVDGPVRLTQYQSDWGAIEYVRVRDVRTTPSSQDPFGAVTAGELTLACSTLVSGQFYHSESRSKGKPGCLDTENALIGTELKPVPISMDCSESDSTPVEDPVFLLITIGCPREVKLKRKDLESIIIRRDNMSLYGIVLQTCGNIKGHFRRVGSFNYHHSGVIGDNVENNYYHVFMEAMEAGGAHTAEAMCTEVLLNPDPPEFPYVITIE
jgi:hypothetical protein